MATGIRIEGIEELQRTLEHVLPQHATSLLRTAMFGIAREIRDAVKSSAPVRSGALRMSVKAKRGRGTREDVFSDVIFESGKAAKNDGFYWRFIEHGTVKLPARPFVAPIVEAMRTDMPRLLRERVGIALERRLAREARKRANAKP